MTTKKKRNLILALAVVLCAIAAVGATYAFFTDTDQVTNTFTVGDLDVTLDEPHWNPEDGEDLVPGDTIEKDPTVTAAKGDSYMRVIMTIVDKDAAPVAGKYPLVTNTTRLAKILQTLYYQKSGSAIVPGTKYSLANISAWGANVVKGAPTFTGHDKYTYQAAKSSAGEYVYYYTGGTGAGEAPYVLKQGTAATLFTHVVIPTDWTQTDLRLLGKYDIVIRAEAIQVEGFTGHADAFAALDAALVP